MATRDLGAAGTPDAAVATAAWEDVLRIPQWDADPVRIHGGLLPGNLPTSSGRLDAVIAFGTFGTFGVDDARARCSPSAGSTGRVRRDLASEDHPFTPPAPHQRVLCADTPSTRR